MLVGALVLFSAMLSLILSVVAMREVSAPSLPDQIVLYLPLEQPLIEHENAVGPYDFQEKFLTVRTVVAALDRGAQDERVRGFVMTLRGGGMTLAHIQELRAAIARFREAGKFAYIYASEYQGLGHYYLASAFEQIWLQPVGILSMPGLNAEIPYAREAMDKLGIEPQIFARKEYKTFFESVTRTGMPDTTRAMMEGVVGDIGDVMIADIAASRDMPEVEIRAAIDLGLLTDEEARDAGLIDVLDFNDQFNAEIKRTVTGDPDNGDRLFVTVNRYHKATAGEAPLMAGDKPKVALIYTVGSIIQHDDSAAGNLGAANTVVENMMRASNDDDIDTVVLRIDSPGGAPAAAEAIRRGVLKLKEKGKRVIVSMGNAAASGGYWIAADADYIFALPGTMTGSIGVTGGKFSLQQMWANLGINWDRVTIGNNAGLWSFNRPYTPSEAARMNALMDSVYDDFTALVAEGRGLSAAQVEALAGGRVWTGNQALNVGLVDALGGLDAALDYAAQQEGVESRHDLQVVILPRPKTAIEKVFELLEGQVRLAGFVQAHGNWFAELGVIAETLKAFADAPIQAR